MKKKKLEIVSIFRYMTKNTGKKKLGEYCPIFLEAVSKSSSPVSSRNP